MKYVAIFTTTTENQDGEQTITTTATTIDATDARTAHATAAEHAPHGAALRIYPDTTTAAGLARGALMVARRTAVNAVKRCGTPTQWRIEREFAAANVRAVGAESAERITAIMQDYSADTQDFFGYAMEGLCDGLTAGLEIAEQYHRAYLRLNKFVHSQRAATDYEISTEFITDGGGDIVAVNSAISSIIRGGDKWTPTDGENMDAATAARLGKAIADAMRIISPTQRKIAEYMGRGYSQRQIAEKMGRSVSTIAQNIAIMRGKIAAYMGENADEFMQLVKVEEVNAAPTANKENKRTAAGAEREKENAARRMREYRARKAAERKAARENG